MVSEKYQNKSDYNITNVIEKVKSGEIQKSDINFNLLPEIFNYHHDRLVKSSRFIQFFSGRIGIELRDLVKNIIRSSINLNIGDRKLNLKLLGLIQEDTKITQGDFDYLLIITKFCIKEYNKTIDILNNLISNNGVNTRAIKIREINSS